jgi:hypothetical protein
MTGEQCYYKTSTPVLESAALYKSALRVGIYFATNLTLRRMDSPA